MSSFDTMKHKKVLHNLLEHLYLKNFMMKMIPMQIKHALEIKTTPHPPKTAEFKKLLIEEIEKQHPNVGIDYINSSFIDNGISGCAIKAFDRYANQPQSQQVGISDEIPFEFVKWYSGMEEPKIWTAYNRWKKEHLTNPAEQGKVTDEPFYCEKYVTKTAPIGCPEQCWHCSVTVSCNALKPKPQAEEEKCEAGCMHFTGG